MKRYANLLNCKLLVILFVYLGVPIGENYPRLDATWKLVLDKFYKKLTLCKHKFISFVGRVCLMNLVLSSLPLFFLSFF